jgi:hypothetical protein
MYDVETLDSPSEDGVLLIKPRGFLRRNEKLRPIRVGACIGHTNRVGFVVLERRKLVFELLAPDAFTSCAVS